MVLQPHRTEALGQLAALWLASRGGCFDLGRGLSGQLPEGEDHVHGHQHGLSVSPASAEAVLAPGPL